jgi:hypothetical protein
VCSASRPNLRAHLRPSRISSLEPGQSGSAASGAMFKRGGKFDLGELDPTTYPDEHAAMLKPCPEAWLEAYAVNRAVNNVRNDDERCVEPALTRAYAGRVVSITSVPLRSVSPQAL